jgi:AmiR/NasT family two-component response regulator
MPEGKLTVAVIDPSRARAAIVEEGLRASGVERVVVIPETGGLLERLARIDPDVIVIDLENPSRDLLEQFSTCRGWSSGPSRCSSTTQISRCWRPRWMPASRPTWSTG